MFLLSLFSPKRCEKLSSQITRWMLAQPMFGVLGVWLVYFGFGRRASLDPFMRSANGPDTVLQWNVFGYHFLYNVIAVALLFWLARRRLQLQKA